MATRQRISTQDPLVAQLRNTQSIEQLVRYLHDELDWPVDLENLDDVFFDYEPSELNLKAEHTIAICSIRQLRPLSADQPWGIFFVEFDRTKLPIAVLRRVLQGLAVKRRERDGGRQRWHAQDLLFVSTWGEPGHKEIAFAHFAADQQAADAPPVLRVLGWDESDTNLQMANIVATLRQNLSWPPAGELKDAWRQRWSGAFKLRPGQTISDAKTLAAAMALFAKRIRVRVVDVLLVESAEGRMHKLWQAFKTSLIADLKQEDFADMFAQTVTYGLFAQRIMRDSGAITADGVVESLGGTNPFLRELLTMFLEAGGHAKRRTHRVDFDELGINDAMEMMLTTNTEAIRLSFDKSKPGEDPVIHLYEDFLTAYDKTKKIERGVFYTPKPVVQFIVRSVHEVLQKDFDLMDGLASTDTWGDVMARRPGLTLPQHTTHATPFVQVLDPATGTATFLVEAISLIYEYLKGKWRAAGQSKAQIEKLWQDYVGANLLPRLFGYELQMAPYAIAHMKVALTLANTGYSFPAEPPRINIYLTNALEPSREVQASIESLVPALAHEARAANRVKEEVAVTVVIGNPPYKGKSSNKGPWITNLMRSRLPDGADHYFRFNNADMGERNPKWVNNDYVKFFRLAQWRLAETGIGVMGYITSNSYLESPTFRGVRQSLLHTFPLLTIIDLHGNSNIGESVDIDQNVFEIQEGVSVAVAAVTGVQVSEIRQSDFYGSREFKYERLADLKVQNCAEFVPTGAQLKFVQAETHSLSTYETGWPVPTLLTVNSVGILTARDALCIQFSESAVWDTVRDFASRDADDARRIYDLGDDARDWQVRLAQSDLRAVGLRREYLQPILYRPFDKRFTYYTGKTKGFLCMPRSEVMRHMLSSANIALISARINKGSYPDHILCTRLITEAKCGESTTQSALFPLWSNNGDERVANVSLSFLEALQSALSLTPSDYQPEDSTAPLHAEKIFHYLYAVLHSPDYRQRYATFLRTDFPRIPIPGSRAVFDALAALGAQLVAWHLLEHPDAINIGASRADSMPATAWFGSDFALNKVAEESRELAEPSGALGKVFVNATSGFANVHSGVWQHTIGGYQVLYKWLNDRRKAGRSLSQDDITHWLRIYASLEATQKLMKQVDEAIEVNGGWPGAFSQNHPPPDAATLAAEQMAQKEQLKAQKKAASATKKRAASASPTGATSLFDFDDDLDGLAEASGAPPRPKPKATPAKAAGGANSSADWDALCAIRAALASAGAAGLARGELIRQVAHALGHQRTGSRIAAELEGVVSRAVRRGIASNERGTLWLAARSIEGYDKDFLKKHLLRCLTGSWCEASEVPLRFARTLGFARTGATIEEVVWSLMRSLQRSGSVQADGRGESKRYRKLSK